MNAQLTVALKVTREKFIMEDFLGSDDIFALVKEGSFHMETEGAQFLIQKNEVTPEVTIYSIANSLTELNSVNKVQISVNGDNSILYREQFDLTSYFEQDLKLLMREEK